MLTRSFSKRLCEFHNLLGNSQYQVLAAPQDATSWVMDGTRCPHLASLVATLPAPDFRSASEATPGGGREVTLFVPAQGSLPHAMLRS